MSELNITEQTSDIFANLLKYYNGCNDIKCKVEESQINSRIRNFYKAVKGDEKLKNYLLKRNKLLFYKNKNTEILPKINLYGYLKGEDREEVVEKMWDNLTLIYLSIEESLENKDQELFGNLSKSLEGGSLGKLMNNLHDEIKDMNVNGMFEKLKANSTPEAKTKATNLLTEMITKLTNNMGDISKSSNPGDSLMNNLKDLAQDYSKMFESGQLDFESFLSAVPDILNNPEEITKNIDTSKLEGLELPDIGNILGGSGGAEGAGGGGAGGGGFAGLAGLSGLGGGLGGGLGLGGGMDGLKESLNKMMGGKLDEMMATMIEKQGLTMLEKLVADEEQKKNVKPLDDAQLKELEDYLKDKKLD